MSRQYGVPYQESGALDTHQVSPIEAYNTQQATHLRSHGSRSQAPQSPPMRTISPVNRRPVPMQHDAFAPPPPPHRQVPGVQSVAYSNASRYQSPTTPNEDSYGTAAAGGGIPGIATGVADAHQRDGGMQTLRDNDNSYSRPIMSPSPEFDQQGWNAAHDEYIGSGTSLTSPPRPMHHQQNSQSSMAPLMQNRSPEASPSPPRRTGGERGPAMVVPAGAPQWQPQGQQIYDFRNRGYDERSAGYIDPHDVADDGDDGFAESSQIHTARYGIPVGAAAGAGVGAIKTLGTRSPSGSYWPVPGNGGGAEPGNEKSEWLSDQRGGNKRMRWIIGIIVAVVIIGAIVGGILGGVLARKHSSSSSGGSSSTGSSDNLYDINSSEVQALLNNKNLHRVFPGMDYTPLNAQYPSCLTTLPSQDNVTLDVAMLAQLTPAIRLYGTDCNQTEMVLTAIDRLGYNDTVKVWLGVWLDNNSTSSERQLAQMYDILSTYPSSHFEGVIVGNEVLFRKDMSVAEVGSTLHQVKTNLTNMNVDLPVATSDLGDNWNSALVHDVDVVMANIHPFLAGVTPDVAAGWTWGFWQKNDVSLTSGGSVKNTISEVGWPSAGGNDCGPYSGCTDPTAGSVAGINEMNTFMGDWICQSLANGTSYFWFEAFDEPWKVTFNTPTDQWESKWGLMDADRNLKNGLTIPDCGGNTAG